jgi:nucleoside-diphosphate-sugar epimerase
MLLITGSTGLLGSHLIFHLLQSRPRVAALKRANSGTDTIREIFSCYIKNPDTLLSRIDWRTGDMLDKESLDPAMEDVDCVVNCAAIVSFDPRQRSRLISNNVRGTGNLVKVLQGLKNASNRDVGLIHISSTSALGDAPGDDPGYLIDEETPRDQKRKHTGYSVSKFESEKIVRESGLNAVILNPGIILGPGQWKKGSSQLFVKAWQGINYYPYGGTGYVDVRDVAEVVGRFLTPVANDRLVSELPNTPSSITPLTSSPPASSPLTSSPSSSSCRYCLVGANLRYREFFNMVTDEYGLPNPRLYAGSILTGIAWRADALRSLLTGRDPLLTRETAASAQHISFYSSEKIKKELGFDFRPIGETIDWVSGCWKKTAESTEST